MQRGQIVRMVNTYTTTIDSGFDRSNTKSRKKGITRVLQQPSVGQDGDRTITPALHCQVYRTYNDQNQNYSNRKDYQPKPCQALSHHSNRKDYLSNPFQVQGHQVIDRMAKLQFQLLESERQREQLLKEKEQLAREKEDLAKELEAVEGSPSPKLVESHYITCKEDVEKWNTERLALQDKISLIQVENNFLKMNVGIHEQCVLQMEQQLRALQHKELSPQTTQTQPPDTNTTPVQTETLGPSREDLEAMEVGRERMEVEKDQLLVRVGKLEMQLEESERQLGRAKERELEWEERCQQLEIRGAVLQRESRTSKIREEQLQSELAAAERDREELRQWREEASLGKEELKKQKDIDRQDSKYLLKKVNQYEVHLVSLQQSNESLQLHNESLGNSLCSLQQQLQDKSRLLEESRSQLVALSLKHEECLGLYSRAMQEKVQLLSELDTEKKASQSVQQELHLISVRYSGQIRQLEESFRDMQRRVQEESGKGERVERECGERLALVKKDYDILYDKYLKYKSMALLLHPKDNKC